MSTIWRCHLHPEDQFKGLEVGGIEITETGGGVPGNRGPYVLVTYERFAWSSRVAFTSGLHSFVSEVRTSGAFSLR